MISAAQKLSTFLKEKVNDSSWYQDFLYQIQARQCLLCAGTHRDRCGLCPDCQADLPWLRHGCRLCGVPLPAVNIQICADCMQSPPRFDRCEGLFHYDFPIREMLAELKFRRKSWYALPLGELMARQVSARRDRPTPDLIIPTPVHAGRLRERGFNQALELAKQVSRRCHIEIAPQTLHKTRPTAPQSTLGARERATNLRGSFAVRGELHGAHILVIDDIVTTGHTVAEMSRVLKAAGAGSLEILCVARTPPGR